MSIIQFKETEMSTVDIHKTVQKHPSQPIKLHEDAAEIRLHYSKLGDGLTDEQTDTHSCSDDPGSP